MSFIAAAEGSVGLKVQAVSSPPTAPTLSPPSPPPPQMPGICFFNLGSENSKIFTLVEFRATGTLRVVEF